MTDKAHEGLGKKIANVLRLPENMRTGEVNPEERVGVSLVAFGNNPLSFLFEMTKNPQTT